MARRIVETALWTLLLPAGLALSAPRSAAEEFQAPDLSAIRNEALALRLAPRPAPAPEEALRRSLSALLDADLLPSSLKEKGWKESELPALAEAVRLASLAVQGLQQRHPSAAAAAFGENSTANAQAAFRLFAAADPNRGCLAHQAATLSALEGQRSLMVKKLVIGQGLEHRAVIVYPKGKDWRQAGVVLDGWLNQSPAPKKMAFLFAPWHSQLFVLRYLPISPIVLQAGPRLED